MKESSCIRAVKFTPTDEHALWYKWWKFTVWAKKKWPFNGWLHLSSFEEYDKLSYREKTIWYFFYKDFIVTRQDSILSFTSKESKAESALIETYQSYRWPVQYFIRSRLPSWFSVKNWWYENVSARLRPRQKWLVNKIPKVWADKVWLIPEINFAMVIDFVDGEQCFENTEYGGTRQGRKFEKELRDCYDYIKNRRPALQKLHDDSYPEQDTMTGKYDVDYAETNRLEKLLDENDTKYLIWIVKNRDMMWT